MSRYDYRVKRKLFGRSQLSEHKDFGSFQKEYLHRRRVLRNSRFLVILIALIILIGIAVFAARADVSKEHAIPLHDEKSVRFTPAPL